MIMRDRFVNWIMRTLGVVTVSDVARYEEFDSLMRALGVADIAREDVLRMAAAVAQSGATVDEVYDALMKVARGT